MKKIQPKPTNISDLNISAKTNDVKERQPINIIKNESLLLLNLIKKLI